MNATFENGDEWTGEKTDEGWWLAQDNQGNIYETKEIPVYRIKMDNAVFENGAIRPKQKGE